ncbi:alpha/beta hydrolase [Agromyces cerinus]|uniref:Alpha/beta hydrolase n=1 Tax=Agromyces cerinus subsp. cerinus TaxID=232089 RepID=A0A1N6E4W0_9MICO|nr:alpha/beta hydrolase [Agromyces cerinus]SIN78013.1 Alpha/beta hydrolase [Agromyces cerinus subsp. cerinus]
MTGQTWSDDDPGAGSVADIRAYAWSLWALVIVLRTGGATALNSAIQLAADGWNGKTADAVRGAMATLQPEPDLLASRLEHETNVLQRYATDLEEIQARVRSVRARRDEAQAKVWFLDSQVSSLPTPTVLLTPGEGAEQERLRADLSEAEDSLSTATREWAAIVEARLIADTVCRSGLSGAAARGGVAASTGTAGGSTPLLQRLAQLTPMELLTLARTHPELLEQLRTSPPEASDVAEWWAGLGGEYDDAGSYIPSALQSALIAAAPGVIGNLGGVAYGARDQANRIWLAAQIAEAEAAVDLAGALDPGPGAAGQPMNQFHLAAEGARTRLTALENIDAAVNGTRDEVQRQLIGLTADVPPLAQVSIGNLDLAENVSFLVPGMGTTTTDGVVGWARAGQNLYDMQLSVESGTRHAVIAWIGYETPPVPDTENMNFGVLMGDYARAGGERLNVDIDAYNAVSGTRETQLNVVAHSYGTTTAADALAAADQGVDAFVMIGSAGIEPSIESVHDLHAELVFAGQARDVAPKLEAGLGDEWAWTGREGSHRLNPMDESFGATRFGTNGVPGSPDLNATTAHDPMVRGDGYGYLESNSESLMNIALATTQQSADLTLHVPPELTPFQRGLVTPAFPGGVPILVSPTELGGAK